MFHHILVPLDGSMSAELAIPLAAQIARASGATLTLLHVPAYLASPVPAGIPSWEVMDADRQKKMRYLSHVGARPYLRDLPVEMRLRSDITVREDMGMEHIDLVVMYHREYADETRDALVEIVTCSISRRGPIPVLLLHGQKVGSQVERNDLHPFRILVALDGSKRAESAIRPAAALSSLLSLPEPGSLHLLCMVRPTIVAVNLNYEQIVKQTSEEVYAMAYAYLEEVKKKMFRDIVSNLPLHMSASLCYGRDMPEILTHLIRSEHALISPPLSAFALTMHSSDCTARIPLESVVEPLLDYTNLPILVMYEAEGRKEKYAHTDCTTRQMSRR
jgi:nucleotide-binding universal stress UspA family protein